MRLTFDKVRFSKYIKEHEQWRFFFHRREYGYWVTEDNDLIADYCEEVGIQTVRSRSGLDCLYDEALSQQRITK